MKQSNGKAFSRLQCLALTATPRPVSIKEAIKIKCTILFKSPSSTNMGSQQFMASTLRTAQSHFVSHTGSVNPTSFSPCQDNIWGTSVSSKGESEPPSSFWTSLLLLFFPALRGRTGRQEKLQPGMEEWVTGKDVSRYSGQRSVLSWVKLELQIWKRKRWGDLYLPPMHSPGRRMASLYHHREGKMLVLIWGERLGGREAEHYGAEVRLLAPKRDRRGWWFKPLILEMRCGDGKWPAWGCPDFYVQVCAVLSTSILGGGWRMMSIYLLQRDVT